MLLSLIGRVSTRLCFKQSVALVGRPGAGSPTKLGDVLPETSQSQSALHGIKRERGTKYHQRLQDGDEAKELQSPAVTTRTLAPRVHLILGTNC